MTTPTTRYACKCTLKEKGRVVLLPFGVLLRKITTDPEIGGDLEKLLDGCIKVDADNYPEMLEKTANNPYFIWVSELENEGQPDEREVFKRVPRTVENIKDFDQAYHDNAVQFIADNQAAVDAGTLKGPKLAKFLMLEAFVAQWPDEEA